MSRLFTLFAFTALTYCGCHSQSGASAWPDAVRRIHNSAIVVDGHNDLPWRIREFHDSSFDKIDLTRPQPDLHTDIDRLRRGGVGAQFWSAYVPVSTMADGGAARYGLEQIDLIRRMVDRYPSVFEMALTADDIVRIHRSGKIASLIGLEGGHAIENSLGVLRTFYDLGVRYLTLTHSRTHDWCDSCTDAARHGGLSPFGEEVIREMNRLGMLVDISHISSEAMRDVLRVSRSPIIASHSSAFALAAHPRNVPDDVLRGVAENGGVIMVNFYPGFILQELAPEVGERANTIKAIRAKHLDNAAGKAAANEAVEAWECDHPKPRGTVKDVVDHIDHIVKVAGIDHVGLGSDYDGIPTVPEQLDDVAAFPNITQELLARGYSSGDIHKILGQNLIRAFREAGAVSDKGK